MSSPQEQILRAVAQLVTDLGLTSKSVPIPVVVLEDVLVRPQLDTVPLWLIAPRKAEPATRLCTAAGAGTAYLVPYGGTVTLVDNGSLDPITNLGNHADLRAAVSGPLRNPAGLGLGFVADVKVDNNALVDAALLKAGPMSLAVGWVYIALEDH